MRQMQQQIILLCLPMIIEIIYREVFVLPNLNQAIKYL